MRQGRAGRARQGVALAAGLLFLLPWLLVLTTSLREVGLPPPRTVEWLPPALHWSNYRTVFELVPLWRYTLNSLLVVAVAVPVTVLVTSWAGLAIALLPERSQRRLLLLSIVLLMIPSTAFWLFRFQLFRWLGLIGSLWTLVIPAFAGSSPLFVLLFYVAFRRIPQELYDAARLDGSGALSLWRRVAMPLSLPVVGGVVMLVFVMYWSDFINPVLYLRFQDSYTLPVALQLLRQMDSTNWPLLMAASVVSTLPVLVMLLFAQRLFFRDESLARLTTALRDEPDR